MRRKLAHPLYLTAIYFAFGVLWIVFSDGALQALVADPGLQTAWQTAKGLLFVTLSSLLVYALTRYALARQARLYDALQLRTRMLQQAQRNAALGSWDYDGQFSWGEEALELLGQSEADAPRHLDQLLALIHPGDRPAARRALLALLQEGQALHLSLRLRQSRDNGEYWLLLHGEADRPGHALGTLQNISAQKRDEQALRESEQRFRQLFEQTPRIAVQGYDRERRVIFWNPASEQLYGYRLQDALGRRLEELIVPEAERRQVAAAIQAWHLGGPVIPAAEIQLQRQDGSLVWVFSSHVMLRNSRGQAEMYCIDIDLTEQRRARDELQVSELRYRELVQEIDDAVCLTDSQGRLTFLNPAWDRLSGHPGHSCLGLPLGDYLQDPAGEPLQATIAALLAGHGGQWQGSALLLRAGAGPLPVSLRLATGSEPRHGLHGSLRADGRLFDPGQETATPAD
ncbi:PAS domain S-box protein [Pseudomonas sp. NPDC077186]|uniref:PAS domain S-box protein n=1 Tax=Pseudomonas sp. NPDC077186 TaxID=3364421 RepID=UPI0037C7B11A